MKAVDLLIHSLRQVFGNLGGVLKVTGLLYALQVAVMFLLSPGMMMGGGFAMGGDGMGGGMVLAGFAAAIASVVIGLWMAVAWHRYILKSELNGSPLPPFQGDRVLAYFGYSLLVGLIVVPVVLVLMVLIFPILVPEMRTLDPVRIMERSFQLKVALVMSAFYIPLGALLFRLSSVLPAAAIGVPLGIGQAWEKTAGSTGTMIVLAFLVAAGLFIFDLPVSLGLVQGYWPVMIWLVASNWVKWVVGVSILTTIYGHYVEGRPLVTQAG
jgi:hypothetical protein